MRSEAVRAAQAVGAGRFPVAAAAWGSLACIIPRVSLEPGERWGAITRTPHAWRGTAHGELRAHAALGRAWTGRVATCEVLSMRARRWGLAGDAHATPKLNLLFVALRLGRRPP